MNLFVSNPNNGWRPTGAFRIFVWTLFWIVVVEMAFVIVVRTVPPAERYWEAHVLSKVK